MGRPFEQELKAITGTYHICSRYDYDSLRKYIKEAIADPIIAVGSGGSFSVATAFCVLIESFGGYAKAITPFELLNEKNTYKCHIVLFTAGGSNPDTINAYRYIKKLEPLSTYVICAKQDSIIASEMQKYYDYNIQSVAIPNGKDGFLAVNSTMGMLSMFRTLYHTIKFTDDDKEVIIWDEVSIDNNIYDRKTIIALGGRLTMPVAIDFESKCTEAGLVQVQVANLRNFAHGRHHWIAKNKDTTGIICFITHQDKELAEKTLRYIPEIPKVVIESSHNNIDSFPELFSQMFHVVMGFGKQRGIDPGRPQVPEFGRRIYHINYNLTKHDFELHDREKNLFKRALYRKNSAVFKSENQDFYNHYLLGYNKFKEALTSNSYNAIVLDYDNTVVLANDVNSLSYRTIVNHIIELLKNGVTVGFATGRGKSIWDSLRKVLPENLWTNVWIGYYSGAYIKNLTEDVENVNKYEDIELLNIDLCKYKGFDDCLKYKNSQITIIADKCKRSWMLGLIQEIIEQKKYKVRTSQSDHSIDIIANSVSKKCLLDFFTKDKSLTALCIGDSGDLHGNDYDLLNTEFGLSVDKTSYAFDTCWNLAPLGFTGPAATLYYLENLVMTKDMGNYKIKI
jgi:fructoselysine-6-P-deglycase FrlB-like protein/hydroxymethylpyrimidine pyrophosphatase-like HAD family hydrolase